MSLLNKIRGKVKSIRVDRELSSLQKKKIQRKRDELQLEDLKLQAKISKQKALIAKNNSKLRGGGGSRFGAAKVLKNMQQTNRTMFSSSSNNDPLSLGDKKFPPL